MRTEKNSNLILAIETLFGGGSLAIAERRSGRIIASCLGSSENSRSEELLEDIVYLFKKNNTKSENIGLIVFATGTGSKTGIKIGQATAKGLSKSFNCQSVEVSFWEALLKKSSFETAGFYMPAGKDKIVSRFSEEGRFSSSDEFINQEQYREHLKKTSEPHSNINLFIHENLFQLIKGSENSFSKTITRINPGEFIAKFASDNELQV